MPENTLTEEQFRTKVLNGVDALQTEIKTHGTDITALKTASNDVAKHIDELRKAQLKSKAQRSGIARPGHVSEDCARHLGGILLLAGMRQGKIAGDQVEGLVKDILGVEARTALTSSDIPLPVGYEAEVSELVSAYGAARQFGTVYPLGQSVVNLPRLKTSPAFGLIAQSANSEVSPQTEFVTFTAQKFGGFVRLPAEIDEDSVFSMGQFLARYAAREMAKVEDHNYFIGTGAGSGANGAVKGLVLSTIDNSKVAVQAGTKTHYSDATLANYRAVRAVVDAPAISVGAYYMHPSFEQHLSGLNTAGDKPYVANGSKGATFDGFPVRWVDIMPAYSTSANASKVHALFGDLSYQYLGIRRGMAFATSSEAGFTTDEIIVRALERFTIGLMALGAVAGLETAAS